jgi:hypothetical protein
MTSSKMGRGWGHKNEGLSSHFVIQWNPVNRDKIETK